MFTLIDEDAIAPFDDLLKTAADKAWAQVSFYPAFTGEQPDRRQNLGHPVPALHHRDVSGTRMRSRRPASIPKRHPAIWDELVADGRKLTKRDGVRQVTQWGVEIPSTGFTYWLFQALTTAKRVPS